MPHIKSKVNASTAEFIAFKNVMRTMVYYVCDDESYFCLSRLITNCNLFKCDEIEQSVVNELGGNKSALNYGNSEQL